MPDYLPVLMNVIVSKLAPRTNAPRILSGSTSAPSNLPAPSSSRATCPTVFRPMRCPKASQGVLGGHPPAPPSPFADHPPETMPSGSWMSVIAKSDSAKMCALDVQTPARLVAAGDVGSGAHAKTSSTAARATDRCHFPWIDVLLVLNSYAPLRQVFPFLERSSSARILLPFRDQSRITLAHRLDRRGLLRSLVGVH